MKITSQNINYIRNGFSKMKNVSEFLTLLNYAKSLLIGEKVVPFDLNQIDYYANLNNVDIDRYVKFAIKKKSGGNRTINAPNENLKLIQNCLNLILQTIFNPHKSVTGFVPNKSIVDNARVHTGNNYVYNIDLKDFFTSIAHSHIEACLKMVPFNLNNDRELIAKIIAGLCCEKLILEQEIDGIKIKTIKSVLPQGAPTSPTLSNIAAYQLDFQLSHLAKRFNLRYTRYVDDITFSSMHNVYLNGSEFIEELNQIIKNQDFTINQRKVRLQEKNVQCQEVTGLVVNEKVNVKRRYLKQIRSWLYLWNTYGYSKASLYFKREYKYDKGHIKQGNPNFSNVLLGKLNFLKMVVGSDDKRYKRFITLYTKLNEEYKKNKKEFILLEDITPITILEENTLSHTPKDTWQFLKLFDDENGFKYLVHDFNNSESEFSRKKIVDDAKKVYNKAQKELRIPKNLLSKLYHFAFKKNPNWDTWEKGKQERFFLGWSSKELIDWCKMPINKDVHPFRNGKYLDKMINPFKHCIELRKGKLEILFSQIINKKLDENFKVKYKDAQKASFLTDVNAFQLGLMFLFNPFQENGNNNKEYSVEISFKREIVNNYRMKIITITHLNSIPHKHSDDEDLIKGDLKEARERFRNLCNWSIEAKFEDGFKRVNILNDNPEIPKIEEINKTEVGFTHILSFY